MWRMAIFLIVCGRFGFDATSTDAAPPDVAPSSLADGLPCDTPVLLDSGGHLPHDVLAWVDAPSGDWLIGVEHMSQDVHRIQRHPIALGPTGLVAGAAELMAVVDHVDVLRFELSAGGYVLGYNEFVLQTGHTMLLTPELAEVASRPLGPLASGNPPLARAGNGDLAMIGLTSGDLQIIAIGDDGAPSGAVNHLATPAEGAALPTPIAIDDGLAVVWHSTARGTCRLAKLRPDLSIARGPVDMAVSKCADAHAAWLPASRRIVVVAEDRTNGNVAGAVWDDNLVPITPPTMLAPSAHWIRIVDDGTGAGAWVAWAETGTVQRVRHAHLDGDGHVTAMSAAVGQLDDSLGHYHTLQHAGQSTVALWTDAAQNRTFAAMRLCR